MNTEKLTKKEKAAARRLNVSAADLHTNGRNCYGINYGLYNDYYLISGIYNGYSKAEIYRDLLRQLINRIGLINE